jgi:hypothetical protein
MAGNQSILPSPWKRSTIACRSAMDVATVKVTERSVGLPALSVARTTSV